MTENSFEDVVLEKILVTLLAFVFFGIAWRFLYTGHPSVIKAAVAFLVGLVIVILGAGKKRAR